MSFFAYIQKKFDREKERIPRLDVNIPCSYHIYSSLVENKDCFSPLAEGTIINISFRGLGMIAAPPFSETYRKTIQSQHYLIYLEFFSPETGEEEKLIGEIRWAKNVDDVQNPYSELGIAITSIEEEQKSKILDQIFPETPLNDEENES